jgi:NAD(P)-dependent dehydrogenase (short-subunit alcohol dehydrogenase family)
MDMGLQNRVVFVTGSSSGIGRASAIAFGREGAKVVVSYQNNRRGAEETAVMVSEEGGEPLVVPYDLADDDSIRSAVETIIEHWGAVHVLVNNAVQRDSMGSPREGLPFEREPQKQWRSMIRGSLEGPYLTIQTVLPSMRSERWGRIVNISSGLAERGRPGVGAYAAAKAGLHGLSRTLARELAADGILTNVVMPGITLTEMAAKNIPSEIMEQVAAQTPTGRLSVPEDVASLIVYLCSGANGHINGEIIRVTGGL